MSHLSHAVRRFVTEVRRSPALAVGTALDDLEREADRAFDGAYAATHSPVAKYTWMARAQLLPTEEESAPDQIPMGEPLEIVGVLPTILNLTQGATPVPLEAIDVLIEGKRKEFLTARAETAVAAGEDMRVVNLPMISAREANRLFGWRLDVADPTVTVQFRWAIPLAIVQALNFGTVQVSLGFFVRPLGG